MVAPTTSFLLPDLGALGAGVGAAPVLALERAVGLHVHHHDDDLVLGAGGHRQRVGDPLADPDIFAAVPLELERAVLVHGDRQRPRPVVALAVRLGAGHHVVADQARRLDLRVGRRGEGQHREQGECVGCFHESPLKDRPAAGGRPIRAPRARPWRSILAGNEMARTRAQYFVRAPQRDGGSPIAFFYQSALTPAALMGGPHLSSSLTTSLARYSALRSAGTGMNRPRSSMR